MFKIPTLSDFIRPVRKFHSPTHQVKVRKYQVYNRNQSTCNTNRNYAKPRFKGSSGGGSIPGNEIVPMKQEPTSQISDSKTHIECVVS